VVREAKDSWTIDELLMTQLGQYSHLVGLR
jgi:hypothetical protein